MFQNKFFQLLFCIAITLYLLNYWQMVIMYNANGTSLIFASIYLEYGFYLICLSKYQMYFLREANIELKVANMVSNKKKMEGLSLLEKQK